MSLKTKRSSKILVTEDHGLKKVENRCSIRRQATVLHQCRRQTHARTGRAELKIYISSAVSFSEQRSWDDAIILRPVRRDRQLSITRGSIRTPLIIATQTLKYKEENVF